MSKAKEEGKGKRNRRNLAKNLKRINKTEEVIKRLTNKK
jgi:hypothetical protein